MIESLYAQWKLFVGLIALTLCMTILAGCGGTAQIKPVKDKPDAAQADVVTSDEPNSSGPYWLIEVSDTKKFSYKIPYSDGGSLDMTATLYFVAWKDGGEEMYGQYEGRSLLALDIDLGNAGDDSVTFTGGIMDDSISDNISFELIAAQAEAVTAEGEDIDLAPLVKFIGLADIIADEYMITQQNWKALAEGEAKLDINSGFGDGERYQQGFTLKAGKDSVLVSVGDLAAAYNLEAFSGTITMTETPLDALSKFRDKVMSRMEERLSNSEQFDGQEMSEEDFDYEGEGIFTVDSEGREGMDTDGDGKLEFYYDEEGHVWSDIDGDGEYEIAGEEGSDH